MLLNAVGRATPVWAGSIMTLTLRIDSYWDQGSHSPAGSSPDPVPTNPSLCSHIWREALLSNHRYCWYRVPPGSFLNPGARALPSSVLWYVLGTSSNGTFLGMPHISKLLFLYSTESFLRARSNVFLFISRLYLLLGFSMLPSKGKFILKDCQMIAWIFFLPQSSTFSPITILLILPLLIYLRKV